MVSPRKSLANWLGLGERLGPVGQCAGPSLNQLSNNRILLMHQCAA